MLIRWGFFCYLQFLYFLLNQSQEVFAPTTFQSCFFPDEGWLACCSSPSWSRPPPLLLSFTWLLWHSTQLVCFLLSGCSFSVSCAGSSLSLTLRCPWTSFLHLYSRSHHLIQSLNTTFCPHPHSPHWTCFSCNCFLPQIWKLHPSFWQFQKLWSHPDSSSSFIPHSRASFS